MKGHLSIALLASVSLIDVSIAGCKPEGYPCDWVTECCTLGDLTCCRSGKCHGGNDCYGNDVSAFELYLEGFTSMGTDVSPNFCSNIGDPCRSVQDCCDWDTKCDWDSD